MLDSNGRKKNHYNVKQEEVKVLHKYSALSFILSFHSFVFLSEWHLERQFWGFRLCASHLTTSIKKCFIQIFCTFYFIVDTLKTFYGIFICSAICWHDVVTMKNWMKIKFILVAREIKWKFYGDDCMHNLIVLLLKILVVSEF